MWEQRILLFLGEKNFRAVKEKISLLPPAPTERARSLKFSERFSIFLYTAFSSCASQLYVHSMFLHYSHKIIEEKLRLVEEDAVRTCAHTYARSRQSYTLTYVYDWDLTGSRVKGEEFCVRCRIQSCVRYGSSKNSFYALSRSHFPGDTWKTYSWRALTYVGKDTTSNNPSFMLLSYF